MRRMSWALLGLLVVGGAQAADVQGLIKKLGAKDSADRRDAANELRSLGKDAAPAVKALAAALKDKDRFVKRWCAEALGNLGLGAKEAIPELTAALEDGDQGVRLAAVKALSKMGKDGLDGLTKASAGASDLHETALNALVELGPEAVPALTVAIKNDKLDAPLRQKAVAAAVKQGKEGRPAVPAIAEVVKNPRAGGQPGNLLRLAAVDALGKLAKKDDKDAVKVLDDIAKDEKQMNRQLKDAVDKALKAIDSAK